MSTRLWFRASLFALLAADTALFIRSGASSKAIDAGAWLVLLALFEAENLYAARLESASRRMALRTVRLVAAAGVVAATIGYVFENNVLDATNSALWIAVVVLLETQVRYRNSMPGGPIVFTAVAVALYGGLAVLVVVWAASGLWFDAYDALLWLIAFVTIELDVASGAATGRGLQGGVEP